MLLCSYHIDIIFPGYNDKTLLTKVCYMCVLVCEWETVQCRVFDVVSALDWVLASPRKHTGTIVLLIDKESLLLIFYFLGV